MICRTTLKGFHVEKKPQFLLAVMRAGADFPIEAKMDFQDEVFTCCADREMFGSSVLGVRAGPGLFRMRRTGSGPLKARVYRVRVWGTGGKPSGEEENHSGRWPLTKGLRLCGGGSLRAEFLFLPI